MNRDQVVNKFSKCPRHIRYVLSVVIAGTVERWAPSTMKFICFVFLFHCGPRTALPSYILYHRVHSPAAPTKNQDQRMLQRCSQFLLLRAYERNFVSADVMFQHHVGNLETDHEADSVFDRKSNADTWKAVKGFWDGWCKDHGKSGCGVFIKGVDRGRWVTISRIAVPLKVGTAMAAEIMGVCVLTVILDLIFNPTLCVQNINHCVDTILKKQ